MTSIYHTDQGARNSLEGAAQLLNEIRTILDQALVNAEDRIQHCLASQVDGEEQT